MALFVPRAKVLADEVTIAIWEIALINLLRGVLGGDMTISLMSAHRKIWVKGHQRVLTVQLVTIQMLCSRVALAASVLRALEFLIESLPTASALPGWSIGADVSITVWRCSPYHMICISA